MKRGTSAPCAMAPRRELESFAADSSCPSCARPRRPAIPVEGRGVFAPVDLLAPGGVSWQLSPMSIISINELHEQTDLWVRKAAEQEPVVVTDDGRAVAQIVAIPPAPPRTPFESRRLLPGFAELQDKLSGGTDSTEIISEMRDGR